MAEITVFHNISRDASFGFNSVFRTGDQAPEGVRSIPMSEGQVGWKATAETEAERHELVKVYEWEVAADSPEVAAEMAWCAFNSGSGQEDPAYFGRRLRSLSKGDVLVIDGQSWSCESCGWATREAAELRVLEGAEAEAVIRERYQFRPVERLAITVPLA